MSRIKLMARRWVAFGAMAAGVWLFTPVGSAQRVPDSPGVLVNPGAVLRDRTPVQAPQGATGLVEVDVRLNAKGEVTDAQEVSGPEALRREVLSTVLNWHYATPSPATARVTVSFSPPDPPPPPAAATRIGAINYRNISPEMERRIQDEFGLKTGDPLPDLGNLQTKVKDLNGQLSVLMSRSSNSARELTFFLDPPGTYRVSSGVSKGLLLNQVRANYPPSAKQAGVQGVVRMQAVIGEGGNIERLDVIEGPEMLRQPAMDAVRQWTYRPYLLNRQPIKMVTEIEINFALR